MMNLVCIGKTYGHCLVCSIFKGSILTAAFPDYLYSLCNFAYLQWMNAPIGASLSDVVMFLFIAIASM
jgi:hypothetical protein